MASKRINPDDELENQFDNSQIGTLDSRYVEEGSSSLNPMVRKFRAFFDWVIHVPPTLLLPNIVALIGAIFLHWHVFFMLVLYWLENVIVGLISLFKMITIAQVEERRGNTAGGGSLFFAIHYGFICMVHGVFVLAIYSSQGSNSNEINLGESFKTIFSEPLFWVIGVTLFIRYVKEYQSEFIDTGEYLKGESSTQFGLPYGRIIILHGTLILCAFLISTVGEPWSSIVLILLKTSLDLAFYRFSNIAKAI